jgi:hypothetical protein
MARLRGFWSERPRRGRDDARLLAAERLHALRHMPYAELRARAGRGAEVEDVAAPSGERFHRRTSVKRLVLATPDGDMVGEYTMASEGNDPRRYRMR